jgi:DNA primase
MPRCEFGTVRRVARIVQEILGELGATGWPKTSGGHGLHVYVRIEPRWGFAEVRRAAQAFAREVECRAPDAVTTTWWRKDRDPAMLFVDYNQNARDHTIASAYSVRGVPEATVSTPCTRASTTRSTGWTPCWTGPTATDSTREPTGSCRPVDARVYRSR